MFDSRVSKYLLQILFKGEGPGFLKALFLTSQSRFHETHVALNPWPLLHFNDGALNHRSVKAKKQVGQNLQVKKVVTTSSAFLMTGCHFQTFGAGSLRGHRSKLGNN